MNEYIHGASAPRRFQTLVLTSFAIVSVFLAFIGLYGLLAYTVRQRKVEIGIRIAVGASRGAVVAMVGSYGLRLASAGFVIGVFLALGLTKTMTHFIYGVSAFDPTTFIVISAVTLALAAAASVTPALKAACVDPVNTLREQ